MKKLALKDVKVLFFDSSEKNGFKPSVTIEVTEQIYEQLSKFWSENQIGKPKSGVAVGELNLKEYDGKYQFTIKLSPNTKYAGLDGLSKDDIGYGAIVDMQVNAYEYNNAFTGGKTFVGASVSAMLVVREASANNNDISELIASRQETDGGF